ncbi:ribonuclease H protein [Trifolium medium]|uniref:Ribonuclease H protein n=1 Tax=Trifolium medium TaxID=97028 RepID=A0A392LYK5_9FABA|nr:ribonuclease H protein [Trifolium medium]
MQSVKEKLCSLVPFVAIQDTAIRINEIWKNGRWDLENLYTNIPDFVKNTILSLRPYIVEDIPDVWVWHNSTTGVYTTKDAYEWLLKPLPINNHVNWKWIWKLKVPANIQFFVWQVVHGAIPTREMLNHRQWCRQVDMSHGSIIFIVMWMVWCARNEFIFNNIKATVNDTVAKVLSMVSFCAAAFDTHLLESNRIVQHRLVAWACPNEGTVCLNVDGSMLGSIQTAGFGGLIRNHFGTFLKGFYGVASQPSVLYAEIMAVLHGLELCWVNGFRNIACYSDSLQAVSLIKDCVSPYHHYANEIPKNSTTLEKRLERCY